MNLKLPVFIFLPGPSLENVVPFTSKLLSLGAIKGTLNRFNILEKVLGFQFDIVYISSIKRLEEVKQEAIDFTWRKNSDLFITNKRCERLCPSLFFYGDNNKIITSELGFKPGVWYNSLIGMCLTLAQLGFDKIYIFGCDGEVRDLKNVYFAQKEIDPEKESFPMRKQSIEADTHQMNKYFWKTFEEFGVKKRPLITNIILGKSSAVTCFPTLTIENFFEVMYECGNL